MADYSCYLTITNNTPYQFTLSSTWINWGYWVTSPPDSISPYSCTSMLQLSDSAGLAGSEGSMTYTIQTPTPVTIVMGFCDSFGSGDNYCYITNPDQTCFSVSFNANDQVNQCPSGGHPLTVVFDVRHFV